MKVKQEDLIKMIVEKISLPESNAGGAGGGWGSNGGTNIVFGGTRVSAHALAKLLVEEGIIKAEINDIETHARNKI